MNKIDQRKYMDMYSEKEGYVYVEDVYMEPLIGWCRVNSYELDIRGSFQIELTPGGRQCTFHQLHVNDKKIFYIIMWVFASLGGE
jgi:hypothetical protein